MNTTKQKTKEPKTRDCKTNEVMEKLSALKPRQPVFCPERLLFDLWNGTWLVETIRASGRVRRVNRPNTRLFLTKYTNHKKDLQKRSHPHRTKRHLAGIVPMTASWAPVSCNNPCQKRSFMGDLCRRRDRRLRVTSDCRHLTKVYCKVLAMQTDTPQGAL